MEKKRQKTIPKFLLHSHLRRSVLSYSIPVCNVKTLLQCRAIFCCLQWLDSTAEFNIRGTTTTGALKMQNRKMPDWNLIYCADCKLTVCSHAQCKHFELSMSTQRAIRRPIRVGIFGCLIDVNTIYMYTCSRLNAS